MGYDWWVPHSLPTDPNRNWNMTGGFRTASHLILTAETWHMIGRLNDRTYNMIGGFHSATNLTNRTCNMIGGSDHMFHNAELAYC
jgi:hypothetical protein